MTKENKETLHYVLITTLILTPFYITFFFKEYLIHGFLISLILGGLNYFFSKKTSCLYINKHSYITLFIINIGFLLLQLKYIN